MQIKAYSTSDGYTYQYDGSFSVNETIRLDEQPIDILDGWARMMDCHNNVMFVTDTHALSFARSVV